MHNTKNECHELQKSMLNHKIFRCEQKHLDSLRRKRLKRSTGIAVKTFYLFQLSSHKINVEAIVIVVF